MIRLQGSSMMIVMWLAACSTDSAAGADAGQGEAGDQKASSAGTPLQGGPALSGPANDSGVTLGQLKTTPQINLNQLVNRTVEEVDAVLGEPTDTGSDRISCVRFLPERVFFACEQTARLYAHAEFEQIRVEFEDGRAALVAVSGLPGSGKFDVDAALASVGISLPEEPRHENPSISMGGEPGDVVDVWVWGNSSARLLVDDLEHRVRLSVINGEWRRAKVEVINNHPLDKDQRARIKLPRGAEAPATKTTAEAPAPD